MTNTDIIEGEKTIALYMGWNYYGFNDPALLVNGKTYTPGWKRKATSLEHRKSPLQSYLVRNHTDLRYHLSWDWLMPVWSKVGKYLLENHKDLKLNDYHELTMNVLAALRKVQLMVAFENIVDIIKYINSVKLTESNEPYYLSKP